MATALKREMRVLYLTFDGLLQPIGYSQVARLVTGLADRGFQYRVVSLERPGDLARADELRRVEEDLLSRGVEWSRVPYDTSQSSRAAATNVGRAVKAMLAAQRGADLVHARSYHARGVSLSTRLPVVFDTRAYWFDERREQGRWFSRDAVFAAARRLERRMYARASGLVTLTALSARDIRRGERGPVPTNVPIEVIPTVVDFDHFHPDRRAAGRRRIAEALGEPVEGPVLGFVGSVNSWYRVEESIEVFRRAWLRNPKCRFIGLSAEHGLLDAKLAEAGVPPSARRCLRADHRDMPEWVAGLDWGLLLLTTSIAKRASMPTKLGEFLAAGVRPIHSGCNAEVGEWIRRTGSGLSFDELTSEALDQAAEVVAGDARDERERLVARARARSHFSLSSGLDRYASLLQRAARCG